jgi:hypothetical protein
MRGADEIFLKYSADPALRECSAVWFCWDPIPEGKLVSALDSFGMGANPEDVMFLMANTLFRGAAEGVVLTRTDFCATGPLGGGRKGPSPAARRIPFERIETVEVRGWDIAVNGKLFAGLHRMDRSAVAACAGLVDELRALAGGPYALPASPAGPAEGLLLNRLDTALYGIWRASVRPSIDPAKLARVSVSFAGGMRWDDCLFLVDCSRNGDCSLGMAATRDEVFALTGWESPRRVAFRNPAVAFAVDGKRIKADGMELANLKRLESADVGAVSEALNYLAGLGGSSGFRRPGGPAADPTVPAVASPRLPSRTEAFGMLSFILGEPWAAGSVRTVLDDASLMAFLGPDAGSFRGEDVLLHVCGNRPGPRAFGRGGRHERRYGRYLPNDSFLIATCADVIAKDMGAASPVLRRFGREPVRVLARANEILFGGAHLVTLEGAAHGEVSKVAGALDFLAGCAAAAWPERLFPPEPLPDPVPLPSEAVAADVLGELLSDVRGARVKGKIESHMVEEAARAWGRRISPESILFQADYPEASSGVRLMVARDAAFVHEWWIGGLARTFQVTFGEPAPKVACGGDTITLAGKPLVRLPGAGREDLRRIAAAVEYLAEINAAHSELACGGTPPPPAEPRFVPPLGRPGSAPPSALPPGGRRSFEQVTGRLKAKLAGVLKARVHPNFNEDRLNAALAEYASGTSPDSVYFHVDDSVDGTGKTVMIVTGSEVFARRKAERPVAAALAGMENSVTVRDAFIDLDGSPLVRLEAFSEQDRLKIAEALSFVASLSPAVSAPSSGPGAPGRETPPARESQAWQGAPPAHAGASSGQQSPAGMGTSPGRESASGQGGAPMTAGNKTPSPSSAYPSLPRPFWDFIPEVIYVNQFPVNGGACGRPDGFFEVTSSEDRNGKT